jgi:hypothetical protein
MGNLINLFAKGAAQRGAKLSWANINLGYARSELQDIRISDDPKIPPALFDELEKILEQIQKVEISLATFVRTFERTRDTQLITKIQEMVLESNKATDAWVHDYDKHVGTRNYERWISRMDEYIFGDSAILALLNVIGAEVFPKLRFVQKSFEGFAEIIEKTAAAQHEDPNEP